MDLMERAMAKEDEMLKGKATLLELCQLIDSDASGSLDVDEFKSGFENNPEFASSLMTMGVFLEDVHLLFDVLDVEGSGTVPYVELVDTLARLKSHISYVILYQLTAIQKHMRDIAQREAPPKEPVFKLAKAEEDPVPAKLREDKYHPVPEKLEGAQGFRDLLDRRFAEMMADNKRRMDQIIEEMDHSFSQAQRLESDIKAPVKKCYSSILEALDHSSSVVLEMLRAEVVPGLNELNDNGETSLLLAIKRQKWEVALAILQRQDFTRLNALDKLGLSCWHHCLVRDRSDVAAAIRHRPDFDVPVALSGEAISRCGTDHSRDSRSIGFWMVHGIFALKRSQFSCGSLLEAPVNDTNLPKWDGLVLQSQECRKQQEGLRRVSGRLVEGGQGAKELVRLRSRTASLEFTSKFHQAMRGASFNKVFQMSKDAEATCAHLLANAKVVEGQYKALRAEHEMLRIEADTLRFCLDKAGILPSAVFDEELKRRGAERPQEELWLRICPIERKWPTHRRRLK
ncbi:unnamed protein product [Effrenium voratum]|uniref:EF-hand domain-containing protein n=1 Tax=Effrenium voratum TaxID=2562239 RepID=A0AA36INH9_9DINO|nr:unnamed protein product [Effrenium voratum]